MLPEFGLKQSAANYFYSLMLDAKSVCCGQKLTLKLDVARLLTKLKNIKNFAVQIQM